MRNGRAIMEKTLAELRREFKITQEELATKIGISKGAIGMYETGKRVPSLYRAKKIARFFGVKLEDLCFHNKPDSEVV